MRLGLHVDDRGRKKTGAWDITRKGVREAHITDSNGGGLALYTTSHPVARQYVARPAELRWRADATPGVLHFGGVLRCR
ncbi:hypothetical protein SBA3_1860012 [Candidatus Sulfopaludibacter sp. SbA3]|nr:hypothetical protein SBA3_1860012 [Candidatus Sulfopaludibacter sp. SbA3]